MITRTEHIFLFILVGIFAFFFLAIIGAQLFRKRSDPKGHGSVEFSGQPPSSFVSRSSPSPPKGRGLLKSFDFLLPKTSSPEMVDQWEEQLYLADLSPALVEEFKEKMLRWGNLEAPVFRENLKSLLKEWLRQPVENEFPKPECRPSILLVVGVNGAGKTTTIGKLAHRWRSKGLSVMVAAADTFRAAAGQQLKVWCERSGAEFFSPSGVKDPAAVAYQAVDEALRKKVDVLMIDTAGRWHTSHNLMEELEKVKKVLFNRIENLLMEIWLVIDGTSGQNAIMQARKFKEVLPITGAVVTKLDSSSKGGAIFSITRELNIPIQYLGIGEGLSDLQPFSVDDFLEMVLEPAENASRPEGGLTHVST